MGNGIGVTTEDSTEPAGSSRAAMRLPAAPRAAIAAVSTATALPTRPLRPGRSRKSRGRASDLLLISGSLWNELSRGGGEVWSAGECGGRDAAGTVRGLESGPGDEHDEQGKAGGLRSPIHASIAGVLLPRLRPPPPGSSSALERGPELR